MCVLGSAERKKERREERVSDEIGAWKHETLHGKPPCKNEVAPTQVNSSSWWAWAENGEGRKENLGLECLSPFYG